MLGDETDGFAHGGPRCLDLLALGPHGCVPTLSGRGVADLADHVACRFVNNRDATPMRNINAAFVGLYFTKSQRSGPGRRTSLVIL